MVIVLVMLALSMLAPPGLDSLTLSVTVHV